MSAEKAFKDAAARLMGAGQTLAHFVAASTQTDPTVTRALQLHTEANAEYDNAFRALMGENEQPVIEAVTEKSIAAMRAELADPKGGRS